MTRTDRRRRRPTDRPARKLVTRPAFEPLEGRLLLSTASQVLQKVSYQDANYTISIVGPGQLRLGKSGQAYAISLSSTTANSSISIVQDSVNSKYSGSLLEVSGITAGSGQIGQVLGGGAVDLVGTIQSSRPIQSIQLGQVGPSARIIANGGLGSLEVTGDLHLGPKGKIDVAGDVPGGIQAGSIELAGGQVVVGHNLAGLVAGSLSLTAGGALTVGNDAGGIQVAGNLMVGQGSLLAIGADSAGIAITNNLTVSQEGRISVGRDLTGAVTVGANTTLDAGQISVGRDLVGAFTTTGNFAAVDAGNLMIGRDEVGAFTVNGDLGLAGGGLIDVGRDDVGGLVVGGNLAFAVGGSMIVGGELDGLTVSGQIVGQGSSTIDLTVGLDLNNWTVLGGVANQGSVSSFNLSVAKDINGIEIAHGLFNDFITAGVIITGGMNGGLVGPDGAVSVFDSQIRAGVQISNLNFAGDVESNRPTDPQGGLTRIVAGEDRFGNFGYLGTMADVTISGSLINAVLAANVEPYGGDGSFQVTPVPPPADGDPGVYNAPGLAGSIAPPFNKAIDPNVQDRVLTGSINPLLAQAMIATLAGVVITTGHANGSDYAGIFAEDTHGVILG